MPSDRLWDRSDEWASYALCAGNTDFTASPEDLGATRVRAVQATCARCPVRPECIELNTAPVIAPFNLKLRWPSNAIWVAGEWLPDASTAASRRDLEEKREVLIGSLPHEYASRPDGML